ncbi:hypothetical protein KFK09_028712 [Dendrobium nobile]|uniref:Secreted protein n=1 Tax=Dendrobium nobile TaxID=94219 RepID=A0A8T3A8F0_DENNO|nr:hypothetical protein KFK09_028712 [Dendrobium nobile]
MISMSLGFFSFVLLHINCLFKCHYRLVVLFSLEALWINHGNSKELKWQSTSHRHSHLVSSFIIQRRGLNGKLKNALL